MTTQKTNQSTGKIRRLAPRLIPIIFALVAVTVVWQASVSRVQDYVYRHNDFNDKRESILPQIALADIRADQMVIYFGIHVEKIYELSLHSRTFSADGSLWVEWDTKNQKYMEKNGINPGDLLTLVNQIERWDSFFEQVSSEPIML